MNRSNLKRNWLDFIEYKTRRIRDQGQKRGGGKDRMIFSEESGAEGTELSCRMGDKGKKRLKP
jgi:hypothetical protein